jgi:hypothetical protein
MAYNNTPLNIKAYRFDQNIVTNNGDYKFTGCMSINKNLTIGNTNTNNNLGYPLYISNLHVANPQNEYNPSISLSPETLDYYQCSNWMTTQGFRNNFLYKNNAYGDVTVIQSYVQLDTFKPYSSIYVSAYFAGATVSPCYLVISDNRVKKNINKTENFDMINDIEITSFNMIENNKKVNYGIIAQQLEKIMPESINIVEDYIPNIMKGFEVHIEDSLLYCIVDDDTYAELEINDIIKIMFLNKTFFEIIIDKFDNKIYFNKFENFIDSIYADKFVAIIGKKVKDFRTVDYNSLLCLSIGNIQNLNKKITDIENKYDLLEEKYNLLLERLNKLVQS